MLEMGMVGATVAPVATSFLKKVLPWLGRGAAAVASTIGGVPLGIAAAVITGAPFLLSLYNGIQEEFNTDLNDLESSIQSELEDMEKANLARILREMLAIINQIKIQKGVLDAGGNDSKVLGKALGKVKFSLSKLRNKINQFSSSSGSWVPNIIADFFSNLRDRMNNLEESWDQFLSSVDASAKQYAEDYLVQNKNNMPPAGEAIDPSYQNDTVHKERKEESAFGKQERVSKMQEFLIRVPDSFWAKAGFEDVKALRDKGVDGIMDGLTRAALDAFAYFISTDLGVDVPDLSGTRLEEIGTGPSLRKVWDIYMKA